MSQKNDFGGVVRGTSPIKTESIEEGRYPRRIKDT